MTSKCLSIIVPCYNEEEMIDLFYKEVVLYTDKLDIDVEFIFVDDGSEDKTLDGIKMLCDREENVKYLSFSRNFGKEATMYAGIKESIGDYLVIMDADLQHPPKLIEQMYDYIKTGEYDVIATKRTTRSGEPKLRSIFSKLFYKLLNHMSDIKIEENSMDFRMMTRQVADSILEFKEYNRFTKGLYSLVGFRTKWLYFENVERAGGKTKWSFVKLVKYSVDGLLSMSVFPLTIISILGVVVSFFSLIFIIDIVVKKITLGNPTPGYASTIAMICFMGGLQIFVLGIIGQYIAKIYLESKHRPIYIIKEKSDNNK